MGVDRREKRDILTNMSKSLPRLFPKISPEAEESLIWDMVGNPDDTVPYMPGTEWNEKESRYEGIDLAGNHWVFPEHKQ